jgi:hypothetical protein
MLEQENIRNNYIASLVLEGYIAGLAIIYNCGL